ncbi:hypothetical protein FKM82_024304 [Ascaphus truei]
MDGEKWDSIHQCTSVKKLTAAVARSFSPPMSPVAVHHTVYNHHPQPLPILLDEASPRIFQVLRLQASTLHVAPTNFLISFTHIFDRRLGLLISREIQLSTIFL